MCGAIEILITRQICGLHCEIHGLIDRQLFLAAKPELQDYILGSTTRQLEWQLALKEEEIRNWNHDKRDE